MRLGRASGACLTLAAAALVAATTAPAATATPATAGGGAKCVAGTPAAKGDPSVRHDDQSVPAGQLAGLQRDLTARLAQRGVRRDSARAVAASLATTVDIPVYAHVIYGTHKGDRRISGTQVRAAVSVLRHGFRGAQSPMNTRTRYYFTVKAIDYTTNDKWFHATLFNTYDTQEKRRLHKAGPRSLNLYFTGGGQTAQGTLLGWSTFPWQAKGAPLKDSVSVNVQALPGGNLTHYTLGDTVVHETGHWLGLLHTFEGGCSSPNDGVTDTPPEQEPSEACTSFLCSPLLPGEVDPVHNFMDYGYDSCMYMFTAGQAARMDQEFAAYRKSGA